MSLNNNRFDLDHFIIESIKTRGDYCYGFCLTKDCEIEIEFTLYQKYKIIDNSVKIDFNKSIEEGDNHE